MKSLVLSKRDTYQNVVSLSRYGNGGPGEATLDGHVDPDLLRGGCVFPGAGRVPRALLAVDVPRRRYPHRALPRLLVVRTNIG